MAHIDERERNRGGIAGNCGFGSLLAKQKLQMGHCGLTSLTKWAKKTVVCVETGGALSALPLVGIDIKDSFFRDDFIDYDEFELMLLML